MIIDAYRLAGSLLKDRVTTENAHLYFPEFVDARIDEAKYVKGYFKRTKHWKGIQISLSLCARGLTKAGNPIVAFVHMPHFLTQPENIVLASDLMKKKKIYTAIPLPTEEWKRILSLEDSKNVAVINFADYRDTLCRIIGKGIFHEAHAHEISQLGNLEQITSNPVILGLFGGNKSRIRKYLGLKKSPFIPDTRLYLNEDKPFNVPVGNLIITGNYEVAASSGGWDSYLHEQSYHSGFTQEMGIIESNFGI